MTSPDDFHHPMRAHLTSGAGRLVHAHDAGEADEDDFPQPARDLGAVLAAKVQLHDEHGHG